MKTKHYIAIILISLGFLTLGLIVGHKQGLKALNYHVRNDKVMSLQDIKDLYAYCDKKVGNRYYATNVYLLNGYPPVCHHEGTTTLTNVYLFYEAEPLKIYNIDRYVAKELK